MPSNNELKDQATELAKKLGIPVDFKGLNNDKLAGLVKDLRAKTVDAETATQADGAPTGDKEAADKEAADKEAADKEAADKEAADKEAAAGPKRKKGSVYVAEGKALSTKRGILGPGEEIFAEDTPDGKKTIDYFLKSGHLVKG